MCAHRTQDMRDVAKCCVASPVFIDAMRYCYEDALFGLMDLAHRQTAEEEARIERAHSKAMSKFINEDLPDWHNRRDKYVEEVVFQVMTEFPGIPWIDDMVFNEEVIARTTFAEKNPRPMRPMRRRPVLEKVQIKAPDEEQQRKLQQKMEEGMDVQVVGAKWEAYPHLLDTVKYVLGMEGKRKGMEEWSEEEESYN